MRQREDGQVILTFQHFEVFHQQQRIPGLFGIIAQVGEVVDDHHIGLY
jgi:hypothetical protein